MSAAIQNEMERLRSERDAMKRKLAEALERESVLAAHLQAIDDAACNPNSIANLQCILLNSPSYSLTKRDLIKQAEALEEFADNANPSCEAQDAIVRQAYDDAETLREQAKGLS